MYKVRFHIAKGKHYKHWQIKDANGDCQYINPDDKYLILANCKLANKPAIAKSINDGANKTVCAWIQCETIAILDRPITKPVPATELKYNPRIQPNWVNRSQMNCDNALFDCLYTFGNRVFVGLSAI